MPNGPAYAPSIHGPIVKVIVTGEWKAKVGRRDLVLVRTNFIAANIFTEPFREEVLVPERHNAGIVILDQMIAQLQKFRDAVAYPETPALPDRSQEKNKNFS